MELQIIRAREFIRLGPEGDFDLKASKAVLVELAGACRKRGVNQALLDLRALRPRLTPVFSADDLITLVKTFREIGFTHQQRLAVLYRFDPHHRARMFAAIANMRGWTVRAFSDFEQAILWLSEDRSSPAEPETAGNHRRKKVPIHTADILKPSAPTKSRSLRIIPIRTAVSQGVGLGKILPRKQTSSARAIRAMAVMALLLLVGTAIAAPAETGTSSGGEAADENSTAELAKKLQNPVASLISVPIQNNWDFGIGPANAMKYTANIQPVVPLSIGEDWNLIIRTILPVIHAESPVSGGNDHSGLGDVTQSFFLSPKKPVGGWILGAGPVGYYPTATESELGAGKWGAGHREGGLILPNKPQR